MKGKFLKQANENQAIIFEYNEIEEVYYPAIPERIGGLAKFSITLCDSSVYSFWKYNDNLELIDILFREILSLSLMNGNLMLPSSTDKSQYISHYRSVQCEKMTIPDSKNSRETSKQIEFQMVDLSETTKSNIKQLQKLIYIDQKNIFGGRSSIKVKEILSELVQTKEEGNYLLNGYYTLFQKDLIKELIKLSSSYAIIKDNLALFIDLNIVESSFPHSKM